MDGYSIPRVSYENCILPGEANPRRSVSSVVKILTNRLQESAQMKASIRNLRRKIAYHLFLNWFYICQRRTHSVYSYNALDIIINSNLTWFEHISNICNRRTAKYTYYKNVFNKFPFKGSLNSTDYT